mgnify:FL=1|tara:strand:- start:1975 stop:2622 length:648 start_codon:yes stop_codon:yes gene_type:complete
MNFKKNKYSVIKNAINFDVVNFIYKYFLNKRKVARHLFDTSYLSPYREEWGTWADHQIPETYSHYSDLAMETLLENLQPLMEKETELKLCPTYSYARIYKKGDELKRHKDRFSCEISTTMNLGGDNWPIYLDPTNTEIPDQNKTYVPIGNKGVEINLEPGDMLIYSGCELEHWREKFTGENCAQVFLHYNNIVTNKEINKFDGRPFLGLPDYYKK